MGPKKKKNTKSPPHLRQKFPTHTKKNKSKIHQRASMQERRENDMGPKPSEPLSLRHRWHRTGVGPYAKMLQERNSGEIFRRHGRKTWRKFGEKLRRFSSFNFQEKSPQEISRKILGKFHGPWNKILSPRDSGSLGAQSGLASLKCLTSVRVSLQVGVSKGVSEKVSRDPLQAPGSGVSNSRKRALDVPKRHPPKGHPQKLLEFYQQCAY